MWKNITIPKDTTEEEPYFSEPQILMRLKYHKQSAVIFVNRIIPHAKSYGTETTFVSRIIPESERNVIDTLD